MKLILIWLIKLMRINKLLFLFFSFKVELFLRFGPAMFCAIFFGCLFFFQARSFFAFFIEIDDV